MIPLIVIAFIFLAIFAKGGDWFDCLNFNSHYSCAETNFEFDAFFIFLCCASLFGAGYLYFQMCPVNSVDVVAPVSSPRTVAATVAQHSHNHKHHKM